MSGDMLVSPKATPRLVVTMPPEPSRLADALGADIASEYVALRARRTHSPIWPGARASALPS
jgi:hypothetical protein